MDEQGRRIRIGAFELDPRSGDLWRDGRCRALPEQPLAVLKALLQRPGEIVRGEELCQLLWPSGTFVDFEHGLNAAVKRLRDALGDTADVPGYIETIPRRGYRLIAPVDRGDVRDDQVLPSARSRLSALAGRFDRAARRAPRRRCSGLASRQ
jgi:DNA-binding winged helix-turn-helix (wHTH) protein